MSLRLRLILLFFGGTLFVWVPVNFYLYKAALAEVDTLWDAHLAQSARVLLAFAVASAEETDLDRLGELLPRLVPAYLPAMHGARAESGTAHKRSFAFQLLSRDNAFKLKSPGAPDEPLADGVAGFSYRVIDGTAWRVFGVADPKYSLILYAGEDHGVRKDLAWHLVEHLVFPSLLAIPPLLLLIWFAVDKGLKPLALLVTEVKQRAPTDLQPLVGGATPVELEPLTSALNSLFTRLESALDRERQFTGNAAHELRTPLAALRVQAQVTQLATCEEQRQRGLRQIVAGVDRTSRLLDQLLTLARLDNRHGAPSAGPVRLLEVVRRTAIDLEPLARENRCSIAVRGDQDAVSPGDDTCLGILLRNLIDNALRYAGSGGRVTVSVHGGCTCNSLIVDDSGPGIAGDQHDEMFLRFRRGHGTGKPGIGLGLSIVRRICELHGGSVRLENRAEGGLRCDVQLPRFAGQPSAPTGIPRQGLVAADIGAAERPGPPPDPVPLLPPTLP